MTKHVVLVGMMGAGKSSVGRRVAARLVWPFSDSDAVVEARYGRTVAAIWRDDGEEAFRVMETDALREALEDPTPSVIAAAGVVAETMVALVLAGEALRKFGGDSLDELLRNKAGYDAAVAAQSAGGPRAPGDA